MKDFIVYENQVLRLYLFDFLIISICPKVKKNLQSQNIIATVQSSIKSGHWVG